MLITDVFNIGDNVQWITVRQSGGATDIRKHEGVIDEIYGSEGLIKSPFFKRRRRVSLSKLEHISDKHCRDGGKCHHHCQNGCFREKACVPLSGSGLDDHWHPIT